MIADWILQVGKISLFASLLIVLLLVLTPLLQKRYRARWRYFAWLVIALRLLVPVNFTLPQAPIHIELPIQPTVTAVTPQPSEERPDVQVDIPQEAASTPAPNVSEVPVDVDFPNTTAINPLTIAGGIWLAGMLGFLLFQIASYQVFLRELKTSQMQEVPQQVKETVWRIGVDMGICRLPEAVVTNAIDAPVLIGVLRPRVLLPHINYSDEEIAFILRHELVHYRRRDMWYKLVLLLAGAVHWFNPLVYVMTLQAAKDIELACDDDVARELDREARVRYGETILAALPQKRRLEPMFSTHFGSTKQNMKRRLRNLFDVAVKRRGIATLCAFAICAATMTGAVSFQATAAYPAVSLTTHPENRNAAIDFAASESSPGQDSAADASVQKEIRFIWPTDGGEITSGFYEYVGHTGVDIAREQGTDIYAAAPGTVIASKTSYYGYGKHIVIDHGGGYQTLYAHCDTLLAEVGDEVDTGRVIATVGRSGNTTEYALHFEVRENGEAMDPADYISPTKLSFSVERLGQHSFQSGGALHAELAWDGDGYPMLLYTDRDYNDDEILLLLQGLPGIPNPDESKVDRGKMGGVFNFSQSPSSPLVWNVNPNPGAYYFYLIHFGNTGRVSGAIRATNGGITKDLMPGATGPEASGSRVAFQLSSNGGKSITQSSSFAAEAGQKLTITVTSSIKGGTVDLFLFSPSGKEHRYTFSGQNATETLELSTGTWAYNCTGFFDSGEISITGTRPPG